MNCLENSNKFEQYQVTVNATINNKRLKQSITTGCVRLRNLNPRTKNLPRTRLSKFWKTSSNWSFFTHTLQSLWLCSEKQEQYEYGICKCCHRFLAMFNYTLLWHRLTISSAPIYRLPVVLSIITKIQVEHSAKNKIKCFWQCPFP